MYFHLNYVDTYSNTTSIPNGRHIWHFLWAKIFNLLSLENNQILLKAQIIHLVQTYIAFFSIYFFSKVLIRNTFLQISHIHIQYLSLWSTIIWFTIYATHSMHYHLVWNLWYSISYQITLPLFFYITALIIILCFEKVSSLKKIFFIFQIFLLSRFILQAHSMEFMYFLMYISVLGILYIKELFYIVKKYPLYTILGLTIISFMIKYFQPDSSKLFHYFNYENFPHLYENIMTSGEKLIAGYNRASASINELIYLNIFLGTIVLVIVIFNYIKHKQTTIMNVKMFLFLFFTSIFILIPLFQFSSGLFAIITKITAVNRLYFSSSIFMILPVSIYYFFRYTNKTSFKILPINITIFLILVSIWLYSNYTNGVNHNYYKNIKSLYNSFSPQKYAFNLSAKEIQDVGKKIQYYEKKNTTKKTLYFYARDDISFVIKFIYRKNVLWHLRGNKNYIQSYNNDQNTSHVPILFESPLGFPQYIRYK